MKYHEALELLENYNKDELLFKEYYNLDKTPQNIQEFINKYYGDKDNLNIVLHPESLPTIERKMII